MNSRPVAVVTGASSGIGAAAAKSLADAGFDVVLGARRADKLKAVAAGIGEHATAIELDVTNQDSVDAFAAQVPRCDLLVNNAGGAKGMEPLPDADLDKWQWMYDVNVIGMVRMTKAFLPKLAEAEGARGQVIVIGSIASRQVYPGGAGYNAAKHAERAATEVMRKEAAEFGVRVCEIDPGRVHTDFSLVRFDGDEEKAEAVYAGVQSLQASDIADIISFVATRPAHVNLDSILVTPTDQVSAAPKAR